MRIVALCACRLRILLRASHFLLRASCSSNRLTPQGSQQGVAVGQAALRFFLHVKSIPSRLKSSTCFTANLFLACRGRLRVSQRVSSLQVGVVFLFHGESLSGRTDPSGFFRASLFLAGQSRLRTSFPHANTVSELLMVCLSTFLTCIVSKINKLT